MTRTYLFARYWQGFTDTFPASRFDDVPDERLADALSDACAIECGAKGVDLMAVGIDVASECIGWTRGKAPSMPKWYAFHSAANPVAAREAVPSILKSMTNWGVCTIRARDGAEFTVAEMASFEREVARLDEWNREEWLKGERAFDGQDFIVRIFCRLRAEALALSRARARVEKRLRPLGKTRESDESRAERHASSGLDSGLSDPQKRKLLSPAENKCLEEFLEACVSRDLPGARATPEHWEAAGRPGSWDTWRRNVSEALRKMLGPAKDRGDALSRSVISIKERSERET